jgi:hypothetical protein
LAPRVKPLDDVKPFDLVLGITCDAVYHAGQCTGSSLAWIAVAFNLVIRRRRTTGVPPIAFNTESATDVTGMDRSDHGDAPEDLVVGATRRLDMHRD